MEKRKAYIITALIVLSLITGLAIWYVYITQKESSVGALTELDYYGVTGSQTRPLSPGESMGSFGQADTPGDSEVPTTTTPTTSGEAPVPLTETWSLSNIHANPTAGAHFVLNGTTSLVEIVERKTGSTLEYDIASKEKTRLSGVAFARVQKALILDNERTLLIFETEPAKIIQASTGQTLFVIPDTILDVTYDGFAKLFYLSPNLDGGADLYAFSLASNSTEKLWSSAIRGWVLSYIDSHRLAISQKPTIGVPGYAYLFNIQTKTIEPIAQDKPGLMVQVAQNGNILFSTSDSRGTLLYVKTASSTNETSFKTLAQKCIWANNAEEFYCAVPKQIPSSAPDAWLKGQISFTDSLWRINIKTGEAYLITGDTGLDIVDIKEGNGMLLFKNKTDQTLWSVVRNTI